ncbi:clasp N terminal-domain-containing protein [Crepidotus variabilis]|uniref:Clasp N terminal-domain-containing protein n=1 Tax=Crepidotus variabilis TaxID=179855 RepID=A0A9P6JUL2_9AGAR|nr:clasp N terminal-domain-containing protein [Crepidotus variabilis]
MDLETTSGYEKLLAQCKSNDVDVKVGALAKLQAHFSKGIVEIPDSDTLITILKTSLRTSNVHLSNATLSALPTILPSLVAHPSYATPLTSNANLASSSSTSSIASNAFDVATVRQVVIAFLPTGGIVDRLGDKEKAQAKARETLVLIGGYAFRAGGGSTIANKLGKEQETPLAIFERIVKEVGLASKVWKVREQCILTLVHIRRSHHLFPIRPYLSPLVDCLEDTDAHVRDCARQSVVELFTGPGVTDTARADLKKELTKKSVRKAIVDDVLAKLLNKASTSSLPSYEGPENGDPLARKEYVPPSLALQGRRAVSGQASSSMPRTVSQSSVKDISRPASRAAAATPPPQTPGASEITEITPVYIASSRDLENEFAGMHKCFEGRESEFNWLPRDNAIQRVRGMLKGDVHNRFTEPFLASLKDFIQLSLKTLLSLRTTVATNTCNLYLEMTVALGHSLEPHCEVLFTNLLKMSGLTKKITAQLSQACVTGLITRTSPQPRIVIPLLWTTLQEKTVQSRAYAVAHLKHYIETHGLRLKNTMETLGHIDTLEKSVKKTLADPNPAVRETARVMFWVFEGVWPDRGTVILDSLDATARKQLEKACPNPLQAVMPPTTPKVTKKSSVAAAIAASRAKAKAIATAPPSLRHQATSHAGAGLPRRATSPSVSPKNTTARPSSPLRMSSTSPSPSRSRVLSGGLPRSTSTSAIPSSTTHTRTPSGGSETVNRSTSPALSDGGRRRQSSPLANAATGSTIRKAISTALPASPPSSVGHISPTPRSRNGAVPIPARPSITRLPSHDDDSLLMAQAVPIPEDSDSEDDNAINVMSFSAAFEKISPRKVTKQSPPPTLSPSSDSRPTAASVSNALSTGSIGGHPTQPVVEDALRARAEQAESAAERLLELVESEDDLSSHPTLPPALMKNTNGRGPQPLKPKLKPTPIPLAQQKTMPKTPNNRANIIMKQAALFEDSPAQKNGKSTSLLDVLKNQKQETGWWLKRKALMSEPSKFPPLASEPLEELEIHISTLENGNVEVASLKRLALFCMLNSVTDSLLSPLSGPGNHFPPSPTYEPPGWPAKELNNQLWENNRNFDRLFNNLMAYLQPEKPEDEVAYGLIIVWEILENLPTFLDGKESDIFAMVLRVRYSNKITVLEGTNAIRDILASKLDPVYGLTTLHGTLKMFYAEATPSPDDEEIKASTYSFGLMALGKFILRLPAEIAEEELPRLRSTLITALNDKSSLIVRESAASAIIAAQLVLQDETHLFALLDGLADEKKNLLTYLFDKHGARNVTISNGSNGMEKLEKEMRRLDNRTSTPLRGSF